MTDMEIDQINYYSRFGSITDPGDLRSAYEGLPTTMPELCHVVQGLVLHVLWTERYGVTPTEERKLEAGIRHTERLLQQILELDTKALTEARTLGHRILGNCRTFSVLLASMLQYQGVPARARCGFGRYFQAGWHEDHWVCEYWNEDEGRWVLVDAQLDDFQCEELGIIFNPLDVPRDQFVVAGKAWANCRGGEADPDMFGIFDMHGLWFIRGNLVRDIAALNKVELLPWDIWGLMDRQEKDRTEAEMELLDRVAAMTYDEVEFEGIRSVYRENKAFAVPAIIKSYTQSKLIRIDLASEEVVE